jgi:hypothetical protein
MCGTWVLTQSLHLELLYQPFFVMVFFQNRFSQTICPGWLQTMILLISWVPRTSGMSHQHPAHFRAFYMSTAHSIHIKRTWYTVYVSVVIRWFQNLKEFRGYKTGENVFSRELHWEKVWLLQLGILKKKC